MRRTVPRTVLSAIAALAVVLVASWAGPGRAFEVRSGGIPLSAAALAGVMPRAGGPSAPAVAGGGSGPFPPWMGGAPAAGRMAAGPGLASSGLPSAGLSMPGLQGARGGAPDPAGRATLNEQLFGIRR